MKLLMGIFFGWIIVVVLVMIFFLMEKGILSFRKRQGENDASDEGQLRLIRLSEYKLNRRRRVKTDENYSFYYNVRNTDMEGREVDFNIDAKGFIEPSGNTTSRYRFAWCGDSTTECAIVMPENRFPHLVESQLRLGGVDVASFNAGYSGCNIFRTNVLLMCKILPLRPTHVFVCSNICDLQLLATSEDYIIGFEQKSYIIQEPELNQNVLNRVKMAVRLCIPNIYTEMYKIRRKGKKSIDENKIIHVDSATVEHRLNSEFRNHYNVFVNICKHCSIMPILMTQPSMFDLENEKLLTIFCNQFNRNTDLSYQEYGRLFHLTNKIIRDIARENNVVLIDLEKEVPIDTKYIYDLVHYTDEGCRLIADIICQNKNIINF